MIDCLRMTLNQEKLNGERWPSGWRRTLGKRKSLCNYKLLHHPL